MLAAHGPCLLPTVAPPFFLRRFSDACLKEPPHYHPFSKAQKVPNKVHEFKRNTKRRNQISIHFKPNTQHKFTCISLFPIQLIIFSHHPNSGLSEIRVLDPKFSITYTKLTEPQIQKSGISYFFSIFPQFLSNQTTLLENLKKKQNKKKIE